MKNMKNRMIASVLSLATVFANFTMVSADAAAFAMGDIDMDGVITGHDTAMLSRSILDDSYTLTDEQLKLADYNEDGTVDQADADSLYEAQIYHLGDVDLSGDGTPDSLRLNDGSEIVSYVTKSAAGIAPDWNQTQVNLGDLDLDGAITLIDANYALKQYAFMSAGFRDVFDSAEPAYYHNSFSNPSEFA
ncbi:MAG: dockerin type I repeat-containing protein [Ruminococcus sp.]|nr:dockerin type I repeat-containing protein [Ruminococcus sp.]